MDPKPKQEKKRQTAKVTRRPRGAKPAGKKLAQKEPLPTAIIEEEPHHIQTAVPSEPEKTRKEEFVAQQDERTHARYWEALGRRKTSIARVRLFTRGEKGIWVNEKSLVDYFQYPGFMATVEDPLKKMKSLERFRVTAKISGGGMHAQAEAMRHGISRALVKFNADFRKRLKRAGFLKRDPRMKERKKFGLKGARRAPQWAKR